MRSFLRVAVLIIVVCAVTGAAVANDYFPQSVASGDPTANSVVLWTRVDNPEMPDAIQVEVATDAAFTDVVMTRQLTASADNDWCLKVRVDGLSPYTTYYYRFVYGTGAVMEYSPVGRTKTAPSPEMDVEVRFAVVYCQDYIGRYYNTYLKMLIDHDEDIDFIVHLGDYVYETTGDPQFQDPEDGRKIVFEDTEGAIQLGTAENPYYAAASLSNYRDLYRTYRSDPILQQVHERWPMLVIWDDHEYSDDSWGATATYTDGRVDEYDVVRKQNSERAFFEWIPIDAGLGDDRELDIGADDLYPNAMIYRDLIYGSNLHLVLTDLRSFRPDHLIPEDAFPGVIAVDEPTLAAMFSGSVEAAGRWESYREHFDPYLDMGLLGKSLPILRQTASLIAANLYMMENPSLDFFEAVRKGEAAMSGNVSATFVNLLFGEAGFAPPFSPEFLAVLPRGISYLIMGKTSVYSFGGSRAQIIKDTFDLYAAARYLETGGAAQEVYGSQQNAWLQGTLLASPATWKVLGNSFMMTPLVIDFTNPLFAFFLPPEFPDELRTRLLLSAEDFNGLPQKRLEVLGLLGLVDNAVVISGDIHATFVTDHQNGIYELTPPAISSSTYFEMVERFIASHPIFSQIPGIEGLFADFEWWLRNSAMDPAVSPSDIIYANTEAHGYGIIDVTADAFTITIQEVSRELVAWSYYDEPELLYDLFWPITFTIRDGVLAQEPFVGGE